APAPAGAWHLAARGSYVPLLLLPCGPPSPQDRARRACVARRSRRPPEERQGRSIRPTSSSSARATLSPSTRMQSCLGPCRLDEVLELAVDHGAELTNSCAPSHVRHGGQEPPIAVELAHV